MAVFPQRDDGGWVPSNVESAPSIELLADTIGPAMLPGFRLISGTGVVVLGGSDPDAAAWPVVHQLVVDAATAATCHRYRVDRGADAGSSLLVASGGPGTAAVVLEPSVLLGRRAADSAVLGLVANDRLAALALVHPASTGPDPGADGAPDPVMAMARRLDALAAAGSLGDRRPPVLRCPGRGRFAIFELEGPSWHDRRRP